MSQARLLSSPSSLVLALEFVKGFDQATQHLGCGFKQHLRARVLDLVEIFAKAFANVLKSHREMSGMGNRVGLIRLSFRVHLNVLDR